MDPWTLESLDKIESRSFFKPPETLKVSIPDLRLSQKSKPVLIADIEAEVC